MEERYAAAITGDAAATASTTAPDVAGAPGAASGPPARASRPLVAFALVVVLAGAAAIAWAALGRHDHAPRHPAAWDPRAEPVAAFVETDRGLKFDHPVFVDFLPVDVFKKRVGEGKPPTAAEKQELADVVAELRAVGLVSGNVDLDAMNKQLVTESVIGYYDPDTQHVYVRGERDTPDVRTTLAHELTHALQDQHFGLQLYRKDTTGRDEGYRALYEADAVRVEEAYAKQALSESERQLLDKLRADAGKEADAASGAVPAVLSESFSFPYVFGPYLVKALMRDGGNSRVDAAFSRPPSTDAEIVSPDLYLHGFTADDIPATRLAARERLIRGLTSTYGQVGLLEVLGARVGYVDAWAAVRDWKGDSSQVYRGKNDTVCATVTTAFRTDAGRDRFDAVARRWAAQMPSATVTRAGGLVTLRSCDPGPSYKAPSPSPSPFEMLDLRDGFAQALVDGTGVTLPLAACITDRVLTAMGADAFAKLNSDNPDPAVVAVARAVSSEAGARCRADPDDRS